MAPRLNQGLELPDDLGFMEADTSVHQDRSIISFYQVAVDWLPGAKLCGHQLTRSSSSMSAPSRYTRSPMRLYAPLLSLAAPASGTVWAVFGFMAFTWFLVSGRAGRVPNSNRLVQGTHVVPGPHHGQCRIVNDGVVSSHRVFDEDRVEIVVHGVAQGSLDASAG